MSTLLVGTLGIRRYSTGTDRAPGDPCGFQITISLGLLGFLERGKLGNHPLILAGLEVCKNWA